MKQWLALALVGVALVAVGAAIGRATAPTKTVEKTVTVEKVVEIAAKAKESSDVSVTQADVRSVTHWRVRYITHPDGTVESTASGDSGRSSERASTHVEAKKETEVRYVDREKLVEHLKIVETKAPSWSIGAGAGLSSGPRVAYRGSIDRRLFGPVWIGVYASTAREVGAQVRLEF